MTVPACQGALPPIGLKFCFDKFACHGKFLRCFYLQIAALLQERDELLDLLEEEKMKIVNLDKECKSLEENAKTSEESQRLSEQVL